jgi:hypothetical protein
MVSPDVFSLMLHQMGECVKPYQRALAAVAGQPQGHLEVERLVIPDVIGTAPWDHRPFIN